MIGFFPKFPKFQKITRFFFSKKIHCYFYAIFLVKKKSKKMKGKYRLFLLNPQYLQISHLCEIWEKNMKCFFPKKCYCTFFSRVASHPRIAAAAKKKKNFFEKKIFLVFFARILFQGDTPGIPPQSTPGTPPWGGRAKK